MNYPGKELAQVCMDLVKLPNFQDSRDWAFRLAAVHFFSHRTDPKPRPKGFRDPKREKLVRVFRMATLPHDPNRVYCILHTRKEPQSQPHHGLLTPETGKVPPELSKGHGDAHIGVETASCDDYGIAGWKDRPLYWGGD